MALDDEKRQLEAVHASLVKEFSDRLSVDRVADALAATVAGFEGAPIRTFVPVLAQRQARSTLGRELAAH